MSILAVIVFMLSPILALPFVFIGMKKDKKHIKIYVAIIAIIIALFSYSHTPVQNEDLYRHHQDVAYYENKSVGTLLQKIGSQPEQLSVVYKFLISKTGNVNLLQFFTSATCYYILFYLLYEYTKKYKNIKGIKLFGIWFFVLSGFHFIAITSGIFYTLALEIFSLGVYLDYGRNKKILSWLLYIIPIFIHTCAVLPLLIIALYKLLGSKNSIKNNIILIILILSINILLTTIASYIELPIITELSKLYNSYFGNEEHWAGLHTIPVLTLYLSRLIPVTIGYGFTENRNGINGFAMFMTVAITILYFQTTFSIRYIHIAVLCGIPLLFEALGNKRISQVFCVILYGLGTPHIIYQLLQLQFLGSFDNVHRILVTNLITTLSGK